MSKYKADMIYPDWVGEGNEKYYNDWYNLGQLVLAHEPSLRNGVFVCFASDPEVADYITKIHNRMHSTIINTKEEDIKYV